MLAVIARRARIAAPAMVAGSAMRSAASAPWRIVENLVDRLERSGIAERLVDGGPGVGSGWVGRAACSTAAASRPGSAPCAAAPSVQPKLTEATVQGHHLGARRELRPGALHSVCQQAHSAARLEPA